MKENTNTLAKITKEKSFFRRTEYEIFSTPEELVNLGFPHLETLLTTLKAQYATNNGNADSATTCTLRYPQDTSLLPIRVGGYHVDSETQVCTSIPRKPTGPCPGTVFIDQDGLNIRETLQTVNSVWHLFKKPPHTKISASPGEVSTHHADTTLHKGTPQSIFDRLFCRNQRYFLFISKN